jgi:hypothetical protein
LKTIEIIVSPAGETRLETKGFTGVACKEASRSLEQALGLVQTDRLTAEFHEQAANGPVQTRQG